jgi:hypothetical protein
MHGERLLYWSSPTGPLSRLKLELSVVVAHRVAETEVFTARMLKGIMCNDVNIENFRSHAAIFEHHGHGAMGVFPFIRSGLRWGSKGRGNGSIRGR